MQDSIVFENASGASINLNDRLSTFLRLDEKGLYAPNYELQDSENPYADGRILKRLKAGARRMTLPIAVKRNSRSQLLSYIDTLISVFNPELGNGTLCWTNGSGRARVLSCAYMSGFESIQDMATYALLELTLYASDPFWYNTSPTIYNYNLSGAAGSFLGTPFFPLTISSSTILAGVTLNNDGHVTAWPVITITGPGDDPELENLTTGKSWQVEENLISDSNILVVDTRPGIKTIELDDVNVFSSLTAGSELWGFVPGENEIQLSMPNSTADSLIAVSFIKGYQNA